MVLVYSGCHLGLQRAGGGAPGAQSEFNVTTQSEYYVTVLMLAVSAHRFYCTLMGPREAAPPARRARRASVAQSVGSRASGASEPPSDGSHLPAAVAEECECPPGATLVFNRAYVIKLVMVKALNSAFMGLYAAMGWQALKAGGGGGLPRRSLELGAGVAAFGSVALSLNAALAALGGALFRRHCALINSVSYYLCLSCRLALILLAGRQGSARHVFHSFLMLCFSLAANEHGQAAFAVQLLGTGVLFKSLQLRLLEEEPGGHILAPILSLPEYYLVIIVVVACYKAMCVGKWRAELPRPPTAAAAARRRRQLADRSLSLRGLQQSVRRLLFRGPEGEEALLGRSESDVAAALEASMTDGEVYLPGRWVGLVRLARLAGVGRAGATGCGGWGGSVPEGRPGRRQLHRSWC
jgi:hypothetical protein